MALVSRGNGLAPLRGSPEAVLSSYESRPRLGPPREAIVEDLSVRPSSSGQGPLVAYLDLRGSDYSGQDFSNSGIVLSLRIPVDPRELPLLSGFLGRSITVQRLEPSGIKDLEKLRSDYHQLWETYQLLVESLRELLPQP